MYSLPMYSVFPREKVKSCGYVINTRGYFIARSEVVCSCLVSLVYGFML